MLARGRLDRDAHALEDLLQGHARLANGRRQRRRVGAVVRCPVRRQLTRRRRVGDQRARRRVHARQTPRRHPERALEGVVPAGIQDHNVERVARRFHLAQHPTGAHRLDLQVRLVLDRRAERH